MIIHKTQPRATVPTAVQRCGHEQCYTQYSCRTESSPVCWFFKESMGLEQPPSKDNPSHTLGTLMFNSWVSSLHIWNIFSPSPTDLVHTSLSVCGTPHPHPPKKILATVYKYTVRAVTQSSSVYASALTKKNSHVESAWQWINSLTHF